jgi:hypothetical protein
LENVTDPELVIARAPAKAGSLHLARGGINPFLTPEHIRENLLRELGQVMSVSAIRDIVSLKPEERKPQIEVLIKRMARVISQLEQFRSGPGRKLEAERNRRILEMKAAGF